MTVSVREQKHLAPGPNKTGRFSPQLRVCVEAASSGLPDEIKAINRTVVVATGAAKGHKPSGLSVTKRPDGMFFCCSSEDVFTQQSLDAFSVTETSNNRTEAMGK